MSEVIIKCRGCGFEARNGDQLHRFRLGDIKNGKGYCIICHRIRAKNNVHHRLYSTWKNMLSRCYNQKHIMYHYYGGRGITVCEEWRTNRESFFSWALSHGFSVELTIDRINGDGNYYPENCRWATYEEQGYNKKTQKTFLDRYTRICYICGVEKSLDDFLDGNTGPHNKQFTCKECFDSGRVRECRELRKAKLAFISV